MKMHKYIQIPTNCKHFLCFTSVEIAQVLEINIKNRRFSERFSGAGAAVVGIAGTVGTGGGIFLFVFSSFLEVELVKK